MNLNTRFTIGKIDIAFLYRIRLNDVYLEDLSGDTLLYAESLTVGIRHINPLKQEISIGSINLNNALFRLAIDSARNLNLNYFIDKLRGNGKGKGDGKLISTTSRMTDGRFALRSYYSTPVEYGINYSDMHISGINADIKRFNPSPDSLSFFIKSLQFTEKSGFGLENLTGEFSREQNISVLQGYHL